MRKTAPFLGETNDPDKAFPDIKTLSIKVTQDPYGYYCQRPAQRESTYSKNNLPRYLTCCNRRCQQGGIDLQSLVLTCGSGEYEYSCNGHEGSPQGRRQGDPCDNRFKVVISIEK